MGIGGCAGRLGWAGMGGAWRGDAGVGRVVSLFERDLRSAEVGTSGFLSIYLATLIQRSAFDCLGSRRALAVRGFLLARTGTGLGGSYVEPESAAAGSTASDLGGNARDSARDWSRPVHRVSALPADQGDLKVLAASLGGSVGEDRLDKFLLLVQFSATRGP